MKFKNALPLRDKKAETAQQGEKILPHSFSNGKGGVKNPHIYSELDLMRTVK